MQVLAQSVSSRVTAALAATESCSASKPSRVVTSLSVKKTSALSVSEFTSNAVAFKLPAVAKSSGRRGVVCMSVSQPVAVGYASALLEVARSNKALDKVHKDVEGLAALLEKNGELQSFLASPIVEDEKKKSILKTIGDDASFAPYTLNFLYLLVDKKRIKFIKDVAAAFEDLFCQATETQVAEVVSAVKLENSQQALIAKKLQSLTGAKNIKLKNAVDPALIAGFVIKYGSDGSSSIDMSVKGQLDRLTAEFDLVESL